MIGPSDRKIPALKEHGERKPRILVAPLDWGLGHATRCIPLIQQLLAAGTDVWLATEGAQEELLKTEFPDLPFLNLEGYRAKYSRTKIGLLWKMIIQSPRFLRTIKNENSWLQNAVENHQFDIIISDNRYGMWHPSVPSYFITHQLNIKSPLGKWSERYLQKRNYRYINKFKECWIPDDKENGLAGELSHPTNFPAVPVRYIGALSRFIKKDIEEIKGHILVILSGPEPQRSILENNIISQISHYVGTATIVRGLPAEHSLIPSTNMLRFYNHLPAQALNEEMQKAEFVISRSGYSTIMDIAALQKKSILIPTPGQTEQEYLARYLHENRFAYTISQNQLSLENCIMEAKQFSYKQLPSNDKLGLIGLIDELLKSW